MVKKFKNKNTNNKVLISLKNNLIKIILKFKKTET